MAFDNVTFPSYPMIHGLEKTVSDPVVITSNGTYEYRLKRTRWERYTWTIPTQTMTDDQKEEIKNFLLQRNHALNSFKFIDPDMSAFDNAIMPFSGQSGFFNMNLPAGTDTTGTHPVFNPDMGGLTCTVNGSPSTISNFSITAGQPRFQPDLGIPSFGDVVRLTGPIHFTVRLAGDLNYALAALDACAGVNTPIGHNVSAITLTEVFGEY